MKIALLTDSHAGVRNDSPAFADYMQRFYKNVFYPYLDKNGIRTIIHCGDIVDRRKYINIQTAYRLRTDLIQPALDRDIAWYQIIGNHDTYHKNTNEVSSFKELFGSYHNFSKLNIYDKATEVEFDGVKALFVPWICDENRDHTLSLIRSTNAQIAFGHLELQGFEMYRGSVMLHGDDPSIFGRFDIVCSGHYHHRSNRGNIYYLGSPAEYTWSDYDDPKGFHIFDTETRELEFVQNPYSMFKKFHYNDQHINMINKIDLTQYKDCILKVIVSQKNNPYYFDQFIDRLEKVNPIEIQIVEDHLNLNLEDDSDIVNEAESTIDIFKKYIRNTETKGIDKDKLEHRILELYHEALTIE